MLYLCATPIGNLEDITLRVIRVLSEVAAVYCEDTRGSSKLLNHLSIKKPLISCHEHNEAERAEEIAARVLAGEEIAFISDAGMPCISDPGERIVRRCIELGAPFTVLPGACAFVTAAAISGISTEKLTFVGFLPRSGKERRAAIASIEKADFTVVFYESPLRVHSTLAELAAVVPNRQCALVREISKVYEQAVRGTALELAAKYEQTPPKGECVVVVERAPEAKREVNEGELSVEIARLLSSGLRVKAISAEIAERFSIPRNEAYTRVIAFMNDSEA